VAHEIVIATIPSLSLLLLLLAHDDLQLPPAPSAAV